MSDFTFGDYKPKYRHQLLICNHSFAKIQFAVPVINKLLSNRNDLNLIL
jgi:hypothetical protein